MEAVGEKRYKDVGFDSFFQTVVNRSNGQVPFEVLKCLLDLCELDLVLSEFCWVASFKVTSEQITTFSTVNFSVFFPIQSP